jgi:mono/diheme cytochrome c family protein
MRLALAAVLLTTAAVVPAGAVELGDPAAGLAYARESCAECHAVEPNDLNRPFSDVPAFEEVANVPAMSELALVSFFQTPHEVMPNFVVPPADQRNLIAYILSLRN